MKITQQGFQQNMLSSTDENRKRRMIVIIASASLVMSALSLLTVPYFKNTNETLLQTLADREAARIALLSLMGLLVSGLVILMARVMKTTWLPGILITVELFALIIFSDDFFEVAGGRSTFFFSIPIFVSAITIAPSSTFVFAALTSLILFQRPGGVGLVNVYAIPAVWTLSLSIWLATSTMEQAIHTAQQETQRVRAMLGVVSHELRTPLGGISGYIDLLMLDQRMDSVQQEMLSRAKAATLHLMEMVNRLLDTAHIQSGRLILKPEMAATDGLFEALAIRAEKQAEAKGLRFVFYKLDMPDEVCVDQLRLQQIVSNLVDNAIKFTEKGEVTLVIRQKNHDLLIVVSDTGIGISKQEIPLLFQEFTQSQHYATRDHGGVGLGLSIVDHLVRMMQGTIIVESVVGAGTTMRISLPLFVD